VKTTPPKPATLQCRKLKSSRPAHCKSRFHSKSAKNARASAASLRVRPVEEKPRQIQKIGDAILAEQKTAVRLERESAEAYSAYVSLNSDFLEVLDALYENTAATLEDALIANEAAFKQLERYVERVHSEKNDEAPSSWTN
jgi:hypothetical protein